MERTLIPVHVYGFTRDEVADWQRKFGLQPVRLEPAQFNTLTEGQPVVVHARVAMELTRQFEAEGIASEIILYLPARGERPAGARYDATVREAELSKLANLITHTEQLRMSRLAEDVPLELLTRPIQTLNLQRLGLPKQSAAHLATCRTCPDLLREALRGRVRLYQRLSCPSPEQLIAYVGTGSLESGQLAEHVQKCPLCQVQVEALRGVIAPAPARSKVLISVPVLRAPEPVGDGPAGRTRQELQDLRERLQTVFGALLDLFEGVSRGLGGWQVAGVRSLKGSDVDNAEVLPILQEVYDDQVPVILSLGGQHFYLGWDAEAQAPYLEFSAESVGEAGAFSMELRQAETGELVWSAASTGGRLVIPTQVIENEVREHLSQQVSPEDTGYRLIILEGDLPS